MASTTPVNWKALGRVNTTDETNPALLVPIENDQLASQVIGLANGGFVIVWEDNTRNFAGGLEANDIVGQRYDLLGNKVGGEIYISQAYADFHQQRVAVSALANGGFVSAYQSKGDPAIGDGENIDVAIFNAGGVLDHDEDYRQGVNPPIVIDDAAPAIATFAGGYILTYQHNEAGHSDIGYHIVTAAFVFPNPPPARLNADIGAGDQIGAQIAIISNHATNPVFVIAYEDDATGTIKAFRADVTSGPLQTLAMSTGTTNSGADVAALTGGNYVVAWTEADGDGAGNAGVRFRIGIASGGAMGVAPMIANTTTAGSQAGVSIAALNDGGFAIVWTDQNLGIRGRLFNASGVPIGTEFSIQANSTITYSDPDVARLGDGRLVVTYTATNGTNLDIESRIIDPRSGTIFGTAGADFITSRVAGATLSGLGGNDTLYGLNAVDTLIGGAGADTLRAGLGNDVYVLENGADNVIDSGGIDTITSTITRSLLAAAYVEVDNLTLVNVATARNGTGNLAANKLTGNNFANVLLGGLRNDVLIANGGNDVLNGEAGNDTLTGGLHNDIFVFNQSLLPANRDMIVDMNKSGNDTIRLENAIFKKLAKTGTLNADFFKPSTQPKDANDYIQYNKATGALVYDSNGSGAGGAVQFATLTFKPALTNVDFYVI